MMVSFRLFCIVLFWALFLVLPGCGTGLSAGGVKFRSDEYLFYRLGNNDTVASLSERFWGDAGKAWLIREANGNTDFRPGDLVIVPLKQTRPGGLYENGFQGVPILCYHKFGQGKASVMNMPAHAFDQQMRYLKENDYHVITPHDLMGFLEFRQQIPRRSVIISIDDGYRSVRDVAWPILKRYGFVATLFVYTDYIGISSKALSWDDLREMKAAGFTIGSHSVSHSDLTRPGVHETREQFLGRVKHELETSKKIIDRELDQETIFFSFPFGRSDPGTIAMAKAAGYKMAVTVERGTNPFFSNPLDLRRDMILKRDMKSFVSRLITFNSVSLR
ncbi:MAG: polysaccharide deacetylase family protein [Desulfobacteraceae bacterium]|nr:polysaccharide deacetylase family protein [Desulfobacteraceae bacterium]